MASRSLGQLTLDLIARTGSFEAGMTKAERASSRTSKKIASDAERAAARSKAAFKAISLAVAGAFGGLSIGAGFRAIIDNTKQAEQEQAQLAAVLKSTGEAAGYTRDQLNSMAEALSGKSVFSTNEINQAQTALLAFTGVMGGEFVRAQQAAADMAARTGMSIQSATELIGRALDVPSAGMAALSRQGFRFSDDQKKLMVQLEATGKAAEAQGIILEALEESYGGAAQAARDTFGGALDAVRNTLGDLLTGEEGSLEGARLAIEEFNDALSSPEASAAFSAVVSSMATGASALIKALTAIPWGTVADGAKVVAAVLATRLVVSTGASAASMALAAVQAARMNIAFAAIGGASTTAAVGITAVSVAARAASGAMALLGGPAGLAILAASALTYFALSAGDSKEEAEKLETAMDGLNRSFDGFTKSQAGVALLEIERQMEVVSAQLIKDAANVQRYMNMFRDAPETKGIKEFDNLLMAAQASLDTTIQKMARLKGEASQLQEIMGATDVGSVGRAASKTYEDLAAKINEQILLHGKETESSRLAARAAAGLVEGLKEGEAEKLIALHKTKEALDDQAKAERERAAAAKSAASAAASAAKAAVERAKAEAKAVQDSVAALVLQSEQLGWTASAVKLYDLESKGATEGQLALAAAALEATDAFAAQEKIRAKFGDDPLSTIRGDMSPLSGGRFDEQQARYEAEAKAEQKRYDDQLDRLAEALEAQLVTQQEYWSLEEEFAQAHADRLNQIEQARRDVMLDSAASALGGMADNLRDYIQVFGAQNKTMVGMMKAASIAQTVIQTYQGAQQAYTALSSIPVVGPALGLAAAAAAVAGGMARVAAIRSQSVDGMAHDGIDSVPQTGTWLLEKGERVVTSQTSAKLDRKLEEIGSASVGTAGNITIQVVVNAETGEADVSGTDDAQMRQLGTMIAASARQVIVEEMRPHGLLDRNR